MTTSKIDKPDGLYMQNVFCTSLADLFKLSGILCGFVMEDGVTMYLMHKKILARSWTDAKKVIPVSKPCREPNVLLSFQGDFGGWNLLA